MSRVATQTPLVVFSFESLLCSDDRRSIARLAGQVWRDNLASGLTGEMRLAGRRVQQVVEGPCDVILPLVARILADARHGGIRITALEATSARRYHGWIFHGLTAATDVAASVVSAEGDSRVVGFRRPAAVAAAAGGARRLA
jgi:hypothetical protein